MNGRRNDPELHVEETGSGDLALVFLHGLGGTTRYWKPAALEFVSGQRVVLIDLLGFGDSPKPWRWYTLERHLEALERVLARYPRFVLIGHSLGASLAVALATRHRDRTAALVLFALPRFESVESAYRTLRQGLGLEGWVLTNMLTMALVCILTRRVVRRLLPYFIRDLPRPIVEDLVKHHWMSSTSSLWEVIYHYDPGADLMRVAENVPVTLVHAVNDRTSPYERTAALATRLRGSKLVTLPDGDHHVWIRRPTECMEAVQSAVLGARRLETTQK